MYLTIELLSLPLYGLASIKSRSLLSTEAGLKYFILGAFSSGVFLFGVSLIYLATGSLSFSEIGQLFAGVNVNLFDLIQSGDVHSLGYVAETSEQAVEEYYPGYAEVFTRIGKERGWPPVTRDRFDAQNGPDGAFLVGDPEEVTAKMQRHSEALGGISRFTFQMVNAGLSQEKLLHSIDLIGTKVAPLIR